MLYVVCKLHSTSINCCSSPLYSYFTEQLNLFIGAIFVGYRLEIWKILHTTNVDTEYTDGPSPYTTSPDSILCSLWPCRRRGGRGRQWWWMVVMRRTIIIRLRASRLLGPDPMLQLLLLHPLSETKCIAVGFSHQSVCFIFPDTSFQTTNFGLIPSE